MSVWNKAYHDRTGNWFWSEDDKNNDGKADQYVEWYVIKDQTKWHVDGVVRTTYSENENPPTEVAALNYIANISVGEFNSGLASGKAPNGSEYDKGTKITVPGQNTLQRTGYTFGGWNTDKDGKGVGYQAGDTLTLTEDTTLYAQWLANGDTPYTLICYDADTGDEISNAKKVRRGETGNTIEIIDGDTVLPGYEYDDSDERNITQAAIAADGSTTLKLYFHKCHTIVISAVTDIGKPYDGDAITGRVASIAVDGDAEGVSDIQCSDGKVAFTYGGKNYSVSDVTVDLTVADSEGNNTTASEAKEVGKYTVTVTIGDDAKVSVDGKEKKAYQISKKDGTIQIWKRKIELTSSDGEWDYDGQTHKKEEVTVSDDSDGWLEGDEPEYYFIGSQTLPGTSANVFVPDALKDRVNGLDDWNEEFPDYYDISVTYGKLIVNGDEGGIPITISVNPESATFLYDGKEHSIEKDGFQISGSGLTEVETKLSVFEMIGDIFSRNVTKKFKIGSETYTLTGLKAKGGKGTNAGEYQIIFDKDNEAITDSHGDDVGGKFNVTVQTDAKLTITKRNVVITSATLTKDFDGEELRNGDKLEVENAPSNVTVKPNGSVTGDGWADGEGVDSYSFTASQEAPGQTDNEFTFTLKDNTNYDPQGDGGNYTITKNYGVLKVRSGSDANKQKERVTISTKSDEHKYDGKEHTVEAGFEGETSDGVPVTATIGGKTHTYYVKGLTAEAVSGTDAGEYPISVSGNVRVETANHKDVTSEFDVEVVRKALVITKRQISVHAASLSKKYDGDPLTNVGYGLEVSADGITADPQGYIDGDGLVGTDTIDLTFSGSQVVVGSTSNCITGYNLTNEKNYTVETRNGLLTVTPRKADDLYAVTITAKSLTGEDALIYDGEKHDVSGFEGTGANGDERIPVTVGTKTYYVDVTTVTAYAEGKNTGNYDTTISGNPEVYDAQEDGNRVTDQFNVTIIPGILTIKKATVTLKSADLSKEYDGSALTNKNGGDTETPLAVETGWAEGEGADYIFTGSQTAPSSSPNSFTYALWSNTKAENYNLPKIEKKEDCAGTLTVTERGAANKPTIQITGYSETVTYNGKNHEISGFIDKDGNRVKNGEPIAVEVDGHIYYVTGYTFEVKEKQDVGEYTAAVTGTPMVLDEEKNNVTEQFNFNPTGGTLTIVKRSLSVKSATLEKVYDGSDLTNGADTFEVKETESVTIVENGSVGTVKGKKDSGLADGHTATATFTGKQRVPGISPNSYKSIVVKDKNGNDVTNNYEVADKDKTVGTLTVLNRNALDVTITAKSCTEKKNDTDDEVPVYDGESHSISGFVGEQDVTLGGKSITAAVPVEADNQTYYVTGLKESASAANAGTYTTTTVEGKWTVLDAEGNDVSEQFNVSVIHGELEIKQCPITLTSESLSKPYDGTPLTNAYIMPGTEGPNRVTVYGEMPADEYININEKDFKGKRTLVGGAGEKENTFEWTVSSNPYCDWVRYASGNGKSGSAQTEDTGFFRFGMVVHAAEKDEAVTENTASEATLSKDNYDITELPGDLIVTATGDGDNGGDGGNTDIDVSKFASKTHEKGVYEVGQTIDYTVTATNIYEDARTITIEEQLPGATLDQNVFKNVAGGKTISTMAHYTVTEADALSGNPLMNSVKVTYSGGEDGTEPGGEITVPDKEETVIKKEVPSIAMSKKRVLVEDEQTGPVKIGDTITYEITVLNNGKVTVNNVQVTDELTGFSETVDVLTPDGSKTFTTTYTVKETDVAAGKVINTAIASGGTTGGGSGNGDNGGDNGGNGGSGNGGNGGGNVTVTTEAEETVEVSQTFNLTIHYTDAEGNPIASDYTGSYKYGESFYVESPGVSGYTATYPYVASDGSGMPSKDVDVTVTYVKNAEVISSNESINGGSGSSRNSSGDSDDDDDDDDDDDGSSSSTGSKGSSGTTANRSGSNGSGNSGEQSADSTGASTPEVTDDQVAESNNRVRRNGGTPIGDVGAHVTIDENGEPQLVSASDAETPLFNLGLGDHKCNVLRLLILLAAFAVALVHTKKMRQYQSRLFELKEKLEEEKRN